MKKDTVLNVLFIVALLYLTGGLLNKFCLKPFLEAKKEKATSVVEEVQNPETGGQRVREETIDISSIDDISKTPVPVPGSSATPKRTDSHRVRDQSSLEVEHCDFRKIISENGIGEVVITNIDTFSNSLFVDAESVISDDTKVVFHTVNYLNEEDKYTTTIKVYCNGRGFLSYYDPTIIPGLEEKPAWRENAVEKRGEKIYVDENLSLAVTDNDLEAIEYVLSGGELYGQLVPIFDGTEDEEVFYFESGYIEDSMYITEEEKAKMTTFSEYVASGSYKKYKEYVRKNPPTPTPAPTQPSPKPIATPAPDSSVVHESVLPDCYINPSTSSQF